MSRSTGCQLLHDIRSSRSIYHSHLLSILPRTVLRFLWRTMREMSKSPVRIYPGRLWLSCQLLPSSHQESKPTPDPSPPDSLQRKCGVHTQNLRRTCRSSNPFQGRGAGSGQSKDLYMSQGVYSSTLLRLDSRAS
jgi:hypothetical protein